MSSKWEDKVPLINSTMDRILPEYLEEHLENATKDDVENLSLVFTYMNTLNLAEHSKNLAEHSKNLGKWTKWIGIATGLLLLSAVIQLIALFFCP